MTPTDDHAAPPALESRRIRRWATRLMLAALLGYGVAAEAISVVDSSPAVWIGKLLGFLCVGVILFVLPGPLLALAVAPPAALSRFLAASFFCNIGFWLAASAALKLAFGRLTALSMLAAWIAGCLVAAAAAKRRGPVAIRDDQGDWPRKWAAPAAALLALVCLVFHPFSADGDRYLPDDIFGECARQPFDKTEGCRLKIKVTKVGDPWAAFPLLPLNIPMTLVNASGRPQAFVARFFLCNHGEQEAEVKLFADDAARPAAQMTLRARYDRRKHSRNYHEGRSNCGVLAARLLAPPGETRLRLRAGGAPVEFVSLCNLGPQEFIRRLRRLAVITTLPDTRETFDLSASLIDHLYTWTAHYGEEELPGGGYTSVEPPLHHHLNSLALALAGTRMASLNIVLLSMLAALFAVCALSVRRLAGSLSWPTAGALAAMTAACATFARPNAEGLSPDTTFMVFYLLALWLLAEPADARRPADKWLFAAAVAGASLTQYYAGALLLIAVLCRAAVLGRWRDAARPAGLIVAAALAVLGLRYAVACATHSLPELHKSLRDQNVLRYFGLAGRMIITGDWWPAPYLLWNYALLGWAALCAAAWLPAALLLARDRGAWFYAGAAALNFAFIGVAGFQRAHYVLPVAPLLGVAAAIGLERAADTRRRARLTKAAGFLAAAGLAFCLWAGRDYTGRFDRFSFWCRTGPRERAGYFFRSSLDAAAAGRRDQAEEFFFKAVLADPSEFVHIMERRTR